MNCPLHLTRTCPCSTKYVGEYELTQPFAVGLWVCAKGHGTVGAPAELGTKGCWLCGYSLELTSTTIIPPRASLVGVARDDGPWDEGGDKVTVTVRRVARRHHRCSCGQGIRPGDRYLSHTAFPYEDVNGGPGFWRLAECGDCAARYGRGDLLHDPKCVCLNQKSATGVARDD